MFGIDFHLDVLTLDQFSEIILSMTLTPKMLNVETKCLGVNIQQLYFIWPAYNHGTSDCQ
jgi:hypothetical protein